MQDNILKNSLQAGELVGKLYDALLPLYPNPDDPVTLKNLNMLCVRLVFCFYAEDAGIFGKHLMFSNYLKNIPQDLFSDTLEKLFEVLNTPEYERKHVYSKQLLAFPYIDGACFQKEPDFILPYFTQDVINLITNKINVDFDWSCISPTIFGAVFESTLNPMTRRQGGIHYTSIENIHKVIDPLFLDDLKNELAQIKQTKISIKARLESLQQFNTKLASLKFLDPACGSGNFLTETYISLRKLENAVLEIIYAIQPQLMQPVQVSIDQFYGIEINDFAVSVAKTALWIAESQMYNETEDIYHQTQDYLPLTRNANIVEANALQIDWADVVKSEEVNYIIGNPPFVGASKMTAQQKEEAVAIFGKIKLSNSLDYVGAWYYKAAQFMNNTTIQAAFVSTNSIIQGEQVAILWKPLLKQYANLHIDFAYRSFLWESEDIVKAHVYCVIIGFSHCINHKKLLFTDHQSRSVVNINPYLLDTDTILIESRSSPLCDVPCLSYGNKPSDGGNLILSQDEKNYLLNKYPDLHNYIKLYLGAKEYLHNTQRFCLWFKDVDMSKLSENIEILRRLQAVKAMRIKSTSSATREKADLPYLFFYISQPSTHYLMIPLTSSFNRKYIPIGFMSQDIIASNACSIIPNATLFHFGILTSIVHNAWMRTVAGRLGMGYRYSGSIVYNNFPWPTVTEQQQQIISKLAQAVLDTRKLYPANSPADLYAPLTMPEDLCKAHHNLDVAVLKLYELQSNATEDEIVKKLFIMYAELTQNAKK